MRKTHDQAAQDLKPSMCTISLELPVSLLECLKLAAKKRNVPYQSLIKMWLAEKAFVGSDTRPGDVARHSKRLLRENYRGKQRTPSSR